MLKNKILNNKEKEKEKEKSKNENSNKEISMNSFEDETNSDKSDSDEEVSDYESDHKSKNESNKFKNKFLENVVKYLQTDDLIRKKQKEHKDEVQNLKDTKGELEAFIIRYLDRENENFVDIKGKGKLIKNKSETKAPIKTENIRDGILEGLQTAKLIENDKETLDIINSIMDKIDTKRTVNTRTYLKRTFDKKKEGKEKVNKKSNN